MSKEGMQRLIAILKEGHAKTIPMLAEEMDTTESDVLRQIEYLEHIGRIRRIFAECSSCNGCSGCTGGKDKKPCKSCMPDGGFKNMGQMWEVV